MNPRVEISVLLGAAVLLFSAGLGSTGFWAPDEPRLGAVAEEMRSFVHGWRGLVLLHLNGDVYTQKPPLYYWLATLAGAPGGRVTETAARLPSALAAVATLAVVFTAGRSLFRARTGILAMGVMLTLPGYVQMARSARLDALLTFFVALAYLAAWRLDRRIGDGRANRLLLHGAIGLGVLTKGPVAFLLPALGVTAYLAWDGRWRELRCFVSGPSLLLSLGPGLGWLVAAISLAPPGYAGSALWDNVVRRFFEGTAHRRGLLYYLHQFPAGFLPWTLAWPLAWWRFRRVQADPSASEERTAWRFVLACACAGVAFFSLSAGKRGVYLLPVYPLVAVACAEGLRDWIVSPRRVPRLVRRGAAILAATIGIGGLAALFVPRVGTVRIPPGFGPTLSVIVLAGVFLERALRERTGARRALVAATLASVAALELAVFLVLFPAVDPEKSLRPIAEAASAVTPAGTPVGLVGNAEMIGGIAYYARRPVAPLRDASEVRAFVARGGEAIVVERKDLSRLGDGLRYEVLSSARSGRRTILVVAAEAGASAPPAAGDQGGGEISRGRGGGGGLDPDALEPRVGEPAP